MTYKQILTHYQGANVVKQSEVLTLNSIRDYEKFQKQFEEYRKLWRIRKQVRDNQADEADRVQENEMKRDFRKWLLDRPELIAQPAAKMTPEMKAFNHPRVKPFYNHFGLGDFFEDNFEQSKA